MAMTSQQATQLLKRLHPPEPPADYNLALEDVLIFCQDHERWRDRMALMGSMSSWHYLAEVAASIQQIEIKDIFIAISSHYYDLHI